MRSDWVISGSLHAALLLVGLVTIASSKPTEDLSNYVPVSTFNPNDISRAALGQENAPAHNKSSQLADKIGETKQVQQLAPKVVNKPEITTPSAPPPVPQPKPEQKQAAKKIEKQVDPTQGQKPAKTAEFKPDQIADLLNKTNPPPKPDTPKYDANQIAALLDHRDPQRQFTTGQTLNNESSLGVPNAPADAQLSQTEIDALRQRLRECWSPPPGVDSNSSIYVVLRVLFKKDGSLAQVPVVVEGSPSPLGPALAESGKRALLSCEPFTMLKPEHYAQWKDISVKFSPQELSQ